MEINSDCAGPKEKYRVPKIYGRLLADVLQPVINRKSRFLRKRRIGACAFLSYMHRLTLELKSLEKVKFLAFAW